MRWNFWVSEHSVSEYRVSDYWGSRLHIVRLRGYHTTGLLVWLVRLLDHWVDYILSDYGVTILLACWFAGSSDHILSDCRVSDYWVVRLLGRVSDCWLVRPQIVRLLGRQTTDCQTTGCQTTDSSDLTLSDY